MSALRLEVGDAVFLTNGKGGVAQARISAIRKGEIAVQMQEQQARTALSKGKALIIGRLHNAERLEWLIEKGQELGIGRIILAEMDLCGKGSVNAERWQRIAVSALKQSHQSWLCAVDVAPSLEEALDGVKGKGVFGYLADDEPPVSITAHSAADFAVIGPEADFSDNELTLMRRRGLVPVSLGPARLRSETAALAAAIILQL